MSLFVLHRDEECRIGVKKELVLYTLYNLYIQSY